MSRPETDPAPATQAAAGRRILTAQILSIGSEMMAGETTDTNAGELARSLTSEGVAVGRLTAVPDRREVVEEAFRSAFAHADLVVSTGGLGPTPDDLTRESLAAVVGETPGIDPELERWLRELFVRRGIAIPQMNLKQAWLIPSARALANPNGTAPGWFVERPDGGVAVLLPGPPREMRVMWHDHALDLLRERGLGTDRAVRTLRLAGIGESTVAERLGEALLRRANPEVATYARADGVDVRLSAIGEPGATHGDQGRSAETILDELEPLVMATLGEFVWARGGTTWSDAIGTELGRLGWTASAREFGTGGSLTRLLGNAAWLDRVESVRLPAVGGARLRADGEAEAVRAAGSSSVGFAVMARSRGSDTAVSAAVATPSGVTRRRSVAFLGGDQGRSRAALVAAALLLEVLRRA